MALPSSPTAILVFSHSAHAAAAEKPFLGRAVASLLVRRAVRTARRSGLPAFFFTEKQQRGATFGERFAHAFTSVFEKGFERVIAIGHDCPTILPENLTDAAHFLEKNGAVFGPADDGGAWLVGFQKAFFEKKGFAEIEWQTPRTLAELVLFVEKKGVSPQFLTQKADLDSSADLRRALPGLDLFLKKTILLLLKLVSTQPQQTESWPLNQFFLAKNWPLRAPPGC